MLTCPGCGANFEDDKSTLRMFTCAYCGSQFITQGLLPPEALPAQTPQSAPKPPALPPEFSRLKRPRPKNLGQASAWASLVGSLIWLGISGCILLVGFGVLASHWTEFEQLSQYGATTTAEISRIYEDDSGDSTSYMVKYKFYAPVNGNKMLFEGNKSVSTSYYSKASIGQKIEIIYLPSDPARSAIKEEFGQPPWIPMLILAGMGGLFILIGIIMTYKALNAIIVGNRLRSDGQHMQATLIARWIEKDSDGDPVYLAAYAYKASLPHQGPKIYTRAEQNKALYDRYRVGERIDIRYVPDQPEISAARVRDPGLIELIKQSQKEIQ